MFVLQGLQFFLIVLDFGPRNAFWVILAIFSPSSSPVPSSGWKNSSYSEKEFSEVSLFSSMNAPNSSSDYSESELMTWSCKGSSSCFDPLGWAQGWLLNVFS